VTRTEFYDACLRAGLSPAAATTQTNARYGAASESPAVVERRERHLEKVEQRDIRRLWLSLGIGARVYSTSAATPAKITPGYPDLFLTARAWRIALHWETKSVAGVVSPVQHEFLEEASTAGHAVGAGTFADFYLYLITMPQVANCPERFGAVHAALDRAAVVLRPSDRIASRLPQFLTMPPSGA
jgi:hypothetical protein